jgi:hypothetical protein
MLAVCLGVVGCEYGKRGYHVGRQVASGLERAAYSAGFKRLLLLHDPSDMAFLVRVCRRSI